MLPANSDIVFALSWALVHSLWQGLLIYILLCAALALIPGNYSAARYYVAVSALAAMVLSFIATIMYQYGITTTGYYTIAPGNANISQQVITPVNTVAATTSVAGRLLSWYNSHTALVVNLYIAGLGLLLSRIAYNLYMLKSFRVENAVPANTEWVAALKKCAAVLNVSKKLELLFSEKVNVPMVMGSLKPVILVPVAVANSLTMQEAEAILLHELAHIRRHDYLVNLVQMFIETVLFYNPFVWLVSSVIRREREHCCDDMVVCHTAERLPYAKALAALEIYRLYPATPALAATGSKNQLLNRIKRIMEMKNDRISYSRLTAVLLLAVLLIGSIVFVANDVNAQSKKEKDRKKTKKTESTSTTKKQVKVHTIVMDDGKDDDHLQQQKKVIVIKGGDTVKNLSINKTITSTDEAVGEVFQMLDDMDLDGIIDGAMASVDWNSMGDSINIEMEMDGREMSREVREALAEARKEMAAARTEMASASNEYRAAMAEARKEMAAARKETAIAQKEMALRDAKGKAARGRLAYSSSHDHILDAMEKDGLISRAKGYKVEKKGDELYIDGIRQSKEVFKKYEPMIDAKNMTIKGSNNNISIKVEK